MATSQQHTTTATLGRSSYSSRLSDAEILDHAADLVDEFLVFLRHAAVASDILDENVLPASKRTLENAFRLAIATETRATYRHQLVKAGLMLTRFQEGIGQRLSITPVALDAAGTEEPVKKSFGHHHRTHLAKFDAAFARAELDTHRLASLFGASVRIALRREARAPFKSDGTYTWHGHS